MQKKAFPEESDSKVSERFCEPVVQQVQDEKKEGIKMIKKTYEELEKGIIKCRQLCNEGEIDNNMLKDIAWSYVKIQYKLK